MLVLAVTVAEKLGKIPTEFWINLGLAVLLLVAIVIVLRKLAGANKVMLAVVGALVISVVGFNWIYERNEPKFLTPFVDKISGFFPTKAGYNAKQQKAPNP